MEKIYEWVSPQWKSFTGEVGVIYYFIEVTKVPIVKDYFVNKIPPKIKEGVQQKGLVPLKIYIYKIGETFWKEQYRAIVYAGSRGVRLFPWAVVAAFIGGIIATILAQLLLNIRVEDIKTFFKKAGEALGDIWNFIKIMGLMYMGYLMMVAMAAIIHKRKAPTPPHVVIIEKAKEVAEKVKKVGPGKG